MIILVGGFGFLICAVFGLIASAIASGKRRSVVGFFFLGFFLGVIGILIAVLISETPDGVRPYGGTLRASPRPQRPAGWYDDPWNVAQLRWYDGSDWTESLTTYADLQRGSQQTPPAPGFAPPAPSPSAPSPPAFWTSPPRG